jgi:hypothetical protein
MFDMRRREFIKVLGAAAATVPWPLIAGAQQRRMLRVGYSGIMPRAAPHYAAFEKRMAELGYQEGRNFTFEYVQALGIEGYADFLDQVARGGKAGDLPMQAPSHFHIAFNLKTAKALGLELPPTLIARADEVIE